TPGLLANVVSYAAGVLLASLVLAAPASHVALDALPGVLLAGAILVAANFGIARLLFGWLAQGYRPAALVRGEFLPLVPFVAGMVALVALVALLAGPLGVWALVAFAVVVVGPQL